VRGRGAKMSFEMPRIVAVATPAELAEAVEEGGLPLRIMLRIVPPVFRRRERLVFGAA